MTTEAPPPLPFPCPLGCGVPVLSVRLAFLGTAHRPWFALQAVCSGCGPVGDILTDIEGKYRLVIPASLAYEPMAL